MKFSLGFILLAGARIGQCFPMNEGHRSSSAATCITSIPSGVSQAIHQQCCVNVAQIQTTGNDLYPEGNRCGETNKISNQRTTLKGDTVPCLLTISKIPSETSTLGSSKKASGSSNLATIKVRNSDSISGSSTSTLQATEDTSTFWNTIIKTLHERATPVIVTQTITSKKASVTRKSEPNVITAIYTTFSTIVQSWPGTRVSVRSRVSSYISFRSKSSRHLQFLQRSSECGDAASTPCNQGLPPNFCCPHSTTCIALAGNTTALCCPAGVSCSQLESISCDIQQQNVTTHPESALLTTNLNGKLPTCGDECCSFGYVCAADGSCILIPNTSSSSSSPISTTTTSVPPPSKSTTTPIPTGLLGILANSASDHTMDKNLGYIGGAGAAILFVVLGGLLIQYMLKKKRRNQEAPDLLADTELRGCITIYFARLVYPAWMYRTAKMIGIHLPEPEVVSNAEDIELEGGAKASRTEAVPQSDTADASDTTDAHNELAVPSSSSAESAMTPTLSPAEGTEILATDATQRREREKRQLEMHSAAAAGRGPAPLKLKAHEREHLRSLKHEQLADDFGKWKEPVAGIKRNSNSSVRWGSNLTYPPKHLGDIGRPATMPSYSTRFRAKSAMKSSPVVGPSGSPASSLPRSATLPAISLPRRRSSLVPQAARESTPAELRAVVGPSGSPAPYLPHSTSLLANSFPSRRSSLVPQAARESTPAELRAVVGLSGSPAPYLPHSTSLPANSFPSRRSSLLPQAARESTPAELEAVVGTSGSPAPSLPRSASLPANIFPNRRSSLLPQVARESTPAELGATEESIAASRFDYGDAEVVYEERSDENKESVPEGKGKGREE